MRKKLAMLMASLFLVLGTAWAQVAYTVDATTGSGVTGNGWSKNWSYTTTAEKPAALKLLCNAANMQTRDNLLALYVGTVSPATYTLQVPGKYHIVSYSFDFVKDGEYTNDVTLTVNGKEYKPTSETQTVSVENVNASSTSFVFSGANKGITVSNFVVNIVVAPIELTTDENNPKWYTIKNIRGNAYARYDGDGEAIKLYGDIVDRAFLFYFTAGTTEGTYKIHNAANDLLCAGTNSWTETGAEWYIKTSGNSDYPGFAISTNADLTQNAAWNDYQNAHTSVASYNGNDAGSTWDIVRYEGEVPAIQLSTEGNIVLHYIRSIRRDSYVNFDGHNSTFKEGAQGLASYWYFVQDTEAQDVPEGFIACKIFNAAHVTGVENHSSGFMGTDSWPARTYYIGTSEHNRYGYLIYRSDANLENNGYGCWHDSQGNNIMDYHKNDDGSLWRIYPAGKTGADLMSEATTAKNNALSTIALYESADYYTYSDEAIATAKTAIEAVNTAELHSAVAGITSIPAAMETLQATEKGTAGPAVGDYVRFKNRAKGVYMAATENDGDMIRKSDDATDLKTLWLVEAGENGSVKLKNVATQKYVGAIAQSADVKQKESADASQFTFENVDDVYGAFQTTGGGDYTFANMNEWGGTFKLVGWEKNDKASQWVMSQAYPLTVVYKLGEEELTDLRYEAIVESGYVYTIENRAEFVDEFKTIKSCVANGNEITAKGGVWTVTVNGATTVTVTLAEPEITNRPVYALKSATGTYLGMTPKAEGLVADGVYTIQGDANGARGYMAAGNGYADYPILSEITLSGYQNNSVTAIENGKNWYVYTTAVGTYIYNIGLGKFLAQEWGNINFSDVPFAWTIKENGNYTSIYDNAMAKYLSMGCGRTAANRPIQWDTNKDDGGAQHTFHAVVDGATTYATQIAAAQAAIAKVSVSFQETPLYLYYTPTADGAVFEHKDEPGKFLGFDVWGWNVINERSVWTIQAADSEGFAHIVRASEPAKCLGSDENTNVGTGIYSNVESGCNKWTLEGVYENYATAATNVNGKYHFSSERLYYAGACNILRFTLTESDAKYENGKNRMSFDSFELYDIYGHKVELTEDCFDGNYNKSYAGLLDGLNAGNDGAGCCCGAWKSPDDGDDWFEITLPNNVDLGGAFSFSFVTENTTMNAKAFDISMRYESNNYILNIDAPYGYDVTATYAGEAIADGDIISGEFDESLLEIVAIDGYAHQVTVDEENRLVTVTFVQVEAIVNPAAVVALVNRIGGTGTSNNFKFVHDPSLNLNGETFEIGAEDGKILIKGSTLSALTTGLGWYLNNIAHINIAWNSLNERTTTVRWDENAGYADLSHLPIPTETETHTSDAKYRYYLNTCTFGYSMTSWTWTRWQQEIDWMALHGINMPLQLVGLEEVWRTFLTMEDANGNRKYGYTDEEAKAFVAGPAFIAWWAMNNLQGWGGTAEGSKSGYNNLPGAGGVQDDAWYARQKKLAKQIVDAQRGLGMQPVIPGWSGMVPTNFASKSTYATRGNGGNWAGDFVRPLLLNTSVGASKYAEIAADYYECLHAVMGESQYYSMDPFHEGGGAGTMEDYEYMYAAMEAAKPGSQWVIQQWQWSATQRYSLTAVPAGRLIVLDLFSDGSPAFDGYNGYAPQEAVFCAIPNFGGRSGLMGRLQNVTDNYFKFKGQYESIKGIGAAPEAIEQTPVTYDLIFQLPWMNGVKPDVAEWVDNYAVARYGKDNAVVKEAWSLLRRGPLNYGADGIQGPVEDVWAARPNLDANKASSWGITLANAGGTYTPARRQMLIDAVYKLIDQEDELALEDGSVYKSNYMYDLVEFGGAVMADYAYDLLLGIKAAKNAAGANFATDATYIARRDAFLQLILDMDAFRGTNLNFRLGKWTQEARDAATEVEDATTATPDWYEYNNARTILSTWSSPGTNLTDYSYRSWQGLLKDYYYPRWKHYFDNNCNAGDYKFFEWNWAHGMKYSTSDTGISTTPLTSEEEGHTSKYTREPEGNTVEKAVEMLGKYIIPVAMADGTHYAYRYLTNDLSSKVTIIAMGGTTIDLTKYFGALEGATVTGEFIDGEVTDLANIAVKSDLAEEAYTGTITLADGTVLTFGVSANPKYYGAYQIKYSGDPVFIQYHNVGDNAGNVGYKVVTTKIGNGNATNYKTDYEADKIFTIVPSGVGYSLSAQGQYLKTTASSGWNHIMFSDQKGDAGTYTFTEAEGLVKLKSTNTQGMASVAIFDNGAWGNDVDSKAIGFTIEEVTTYAVTIPESGYLAVCLPFNVVLPAGVTAYDVTVEGLTSGDDGAVTTLDTIAVATEILKAGTPTLLKATAGDCTFEITMDNTDAKTSSPESKLRGNFVKQTLQPGTSGINKYVFEDGAFTLLEAAQEVPANTCWLEAKINAETVDVTEHQGKILKIDDWLFEYEVSDNGSITLIDAAVPGDGNLVIGSYYTVNGQTQRVSAISPTFLHGNTELTSITLPATMTNLGFRTIEPMFEGRYEGQSGDYGVFDGSNLVEGQGYNRIFEFPNDPLTGEPYVVSGDFAWRLTLDVTIDDPNINFNNYGSSIVSSDPNSLADSYNDHMQIYLHKGHQNIVVKIDNNDDRYLYNTKVLDAEGNETDENLVMTHFKFELEHDGAGGYQVVIYYENGKAKMYNISASQNSTLEPFSSLSYSLPEGIHVDVKFEKLMSEGLFVGCTNLTEINVDPANSTFKSCDHGVLYDKNGFYVMRIPEGETGHHFDIPSKVVKLYQGAIHGVTADIVLHSNPQIGVVEGHEDDVKNVKFYLSLDDIDNTITEGEQGYGGARNFTSTNANTYLAARYKRKPLAEGKFGTFMLPFVPENALNKYDFFELKAVSNGTLTFTQVSELKAKTPYIYRLKENPTESTDLEGDEVFGPDESGNDVFETSTPFTVEALDKFAADETPGKIIPLGAYVNGDVETEKYKNSNYYLYQSSTGMFHRVTKKLTYRPYRAFFVWNPEQGQAAPAKLSLRLLDGSTTEIDPSQIEGWEESVYYDLQGRRVLNPTNGVYIVNGKKVIVE